MNRKLLKLNIFLVFLVFVSFVGCSDAEESKKEPWAPYTNDMTPKDYYLLDKRTGKTWHFRIPKSYLTSEYKQKKLGDRIAHIHTGLPSLKPRKAVFVMHAKEGSPDYEKHIEAKKNGLFVSISGSIRTAKGISNTLRRMSDKVEFVPSKYNGLTRVYPKEQCEAKENTNGEEQIHCKSEDKGKAIYSESYFSSDLDPASWRQYNCDFKKNAFGGCSTQTVFRGMLVTYIFRSTEFERREEFEQAVQTLLERFYVDDAKKSH